MTECANFKMKRVNLKSWQKKDHPRNWHKHQFSGG